MAARGRADACSSPASWPWRSLRRRRACSLCRRTARRPGPERSARYAALLVTLDELVARARPDGGWTFGHLPGRRFRPHTSPLRFAEWLARPFGRADWDVVVLRSPGTPAAILTPARRPSTHRRERYLANGRAGR